MIKNKQQTPLGKNSKIDWLDFSLQVLINKGPESIKIMTLCELKKVSKGSFYHHFKNRAQFIEQLMEYWYEKMTLDFIAQANTESDALEKLQKLDQVIIANSIDAEVHIRAWALSEVSIAKHLAKIDSQRQTYLAECYMELGVEPQRAKSIALMAYSSFLGMQQIHPKPSMESVLAVSALGLQTFIGDKNEHN